MPTFDAFVLTKDEDGSQQLAWTGFAEADLMDGDVTVDVSHSTINCKDGLAITGSSPVVGRWPMIPGIDSVMAPMDDRLAAWDRLARGLEPTLLASITQSRPLADAPALAEDILAGNVRGRIVLIVP